MEEQEMIRLVTNILFDTKSENARTPKERRQAIRNNKKKMHKHVSTLHNFRRKAKKHLESISAEKKRFEAEVKEARGHIIESRDMMMEQKKNLYENTNYMRKRLNSFHHLNNPP